jgi:hypothetical protein
MSMTEAEFQALREWHDEAIARGMAWAASNANGPAKDVACDALCDITAVTSYALDGMHGACLGELRTSLGESFGIFSTDVLADAENARGAHSRVLLDVRRAGSGTRYVNGIKTLDTSRDPTPCLRCGTLAPKVAATPEIPEAYQCPSCHSLWFLAPVTRSYTR